MKQQYKGTHTFDVASRTITLLGIEILPERLLLVVNSTVGFVYHNFAADPNADITISGGNTVIVFPQYKDCDTHRATDALSIFYDDGVDLGKLIKDESDETQVLLTNFKAEVKAEFDATQTLLQTELDDTQTLLTEFKTEVKDEFDATQTLLQTELDDTQTLLSDFKAEVKDESDATQTLLQTEFDATQTLLSDFKSEAKAESDATQTILQNEFDETQTLLSDFKNEVKTESDETQALLGTKLPDPVNGRIPVETLGKYEPTNDVAVNMSYGSFGMSQVVFSKAGTTLKTLNMNYDAQGNLVSVIPT